MSDIVATDSDLDELIKFTNNHVVCEMAYIWAKKGLTTAPAIGSQRETRDFEDPRGAVQCTAVYGVGVFMMRQGMLRVVLFDGTDEFVHACKAYMFDILGADAVDSAKQIVDNTVATTRSGGN